MSATPFEAAAPQAAVRVAEKCRGLTPEQHKAQAAAEFRATAMALFDFPPPGDAPRETALATTAPPVARSRRVAVKVAVSDIRPSKASLAAGVCDPGNVAKLVDSIGAVGLLNPITVIPGKVPCGLSEKDGYLIVSGRHRFAAIQKLGWNEVECVSLDLDELHAELATIDENIVRQTFKGARLTLALKRRKELIEAIHPETKATKDGGAFRGNQHVEVTAKSAATFVAETAASTGMAERTVREHVARAKLGDGTLDAIAGTSLDSGVEMDALARMSPDARAPIIAKARAGEKVSARAVNRAEPRRRPQAAPVTIEGEFRVVSDSNAARAAALATVRALPPFQTRQAALDFEESFVREFRLVMSDAIMEIAEATL